MPKGSTSFAYPNPHELAPWIAAEMGSGPSASAADAAAKRISTAGRMFTYSALTVPIAGALAGFGLSRIPTRMPEATYWTIALTLAVLVLFTTASWRSLVGLRWPSVATLFYGAACINRLRVGGNEQHDLRYLTIVLPLLERQLSSPHLASEVAGTKVARLHVAGIQAKLVADIGEAERHWRGERGTRPRWPSRSHWAGRSYRGPRRLVRLQDQAVDSPDNSRTRLPRELCIRESVGLHRF